MRWCHMLMTLTVICDVPHAIKSFYVWLVHQALLRLYLIFCSRPPISTAQAFADPSSKFLMVAALLGFRVRKLTPNIDVVAGLLSMSKS
jgi:hypothetical protein